MNDAGSMKYEFTAWTKARRPHLDSGAPIKLRKGLEGGKRNRRVPSTCKAEIAVSSTINKSAEYEYDV